MTFEPVIKLLREKVAGMRTGTARFTRKGRILQARPMGLYLVDIGVETRFMTSLTDELLKVDDVVLVIDTDAGPRILGAAK